MLLKELTGSQIFLNFKNLDNKFCIHLAPEQSHNQNRSRRKTENGSFYLRRIRDADGAEAEFI